MKYIIERIDEGDKVGKMDIGEKNERILFLIKRKRIIIGERNKKKLMEEDLENMLDINGNEGLIINDNKKC